MIELMAVTKVFQSGRGQVRALRDISLWIEVSRFATVIGKSGALISAMLIDAAKPLVRRMAVYLHCVGFWGFCGLLGTPIKL